MNPVGGGGGGGLFKVPSGGVIVTDSLSSRSVPPTQTSVVGGPDTPTLYQGRI